MDEEKDFFDKAGEEQNPAPEQPTETKRQPTESAEPRHPKRDQLNALLAEEIPDYDPNDEEGAAELLTKYINGNRDQRNRLADALYQEPRLAQALADVINGRRGAAGSLVRYFGKDLLNAEEGTPEYNEIIAAEEERKKEMDAVAASQKEYTSNLEASLPTVEAYCQEIGADVDEFLDKAWQQLIGPILSGNYTREVCQFLDHGLNYDRDTKNAMAAGRVAGRNENINKLREEHGDGMPKGISSSPVNDGSGNKKRARLFDATRALREDY